MSDETIKQHVDEFTAWAARQAAAFTPEQREERRQAYLAEQARERAAKADRLLLDSGAPLVNIRHTGPLDSGGEWGKTRQRLVEGLGTHFLYVLAGARGNGKTQLGVELIRHRAATLLRSSRFVTMQKFFLRLDHARKNAYDRDEPSALEIMERYCETGLLVVDEIGKRSESDWENRMLFELLNTRYGEGRDTLLICNLSLAQLDQALDDSLISRLNEKGGVIECNWPSFRR